MTSPELTPHDLCAICANALGNLEETTLTDDNRVVHKGCVSKGFRGRLSASDAWPPGYVGRRGQRPPRRFSAVTWVQALWPGFIKQFDGEVPAEFWTEDDGLAVIACPCGAEPTVEQNQLAICPGEDCGRVFMLLGEKIWVATYPPEELAAEPAQASNA